ncbi:ABC transporter substrate-binding protein [Zavarzinella formosa]|uniref:ABC transporter substrate-binding protein n=1 Tax=Zavarzinella formosa TaxID=360055 RepID=UPI0002D7C2C0|nr:ABC transporter substrate-binding protein [Zavarzinella formosa]
MAARFLSLGLLAFSLVSLGLAVAQPPRKEEEEEPAAKARPVVPVPVVEPAKKDVPPPADGPDLDVESLAKEAVKAPFVAAKDFLKGIAIPYDRLVGEFAGGTVWKIELLPNREFPESEITVKILDRSLSVGTEKKLATGSGFKYTPYELIILERADDFVKSEPVGKMTKADQFDYAAKAAACGLRFHILAVNNNKRVGKEWGEVEKKLRDRLLKYQRDRFQALIKQEEFDKADELGLRLLNKNPENNDVLRDVYRLQLLRTERGIKSPTDADLLRLRESLLAYERLPGLKDQDLVTVSKRRLRDRATMLVNQAKDLDNGKQSAAALGKLRQAETFDPDLPGIAEVRNRLRGKVLYVGVARLPERMSPAAATLDSEKWAVELMFESLVQAIPDPEMIRYRPQLAEALPMVTPLARSFVLPKNVRFGNDGGEVLDATDVRATLMLNRKPAREGEAGYRHRWGADGLEIFREIDRIDDPFRLRLTYEQGVLEPLSRATFKIIPARYLQELGKNADDDGFARKPFGTGPYRYEGREREAGTDRECAVFRVNPYYSQREGKFGLPSIREIRFFVPNQSTVTTDVTAGQLHLYPDLPLDMVSRFRTEEAIKDTVRVYPMPNNRRIHLLAINHRQPTLQNEKFRQGLSAAINRDAILRDLFRIADDKSHQPLAGPFPVKSWATPLSAREVPLFKPGAGGLLAEGQLKQRVNSLRLCFVNDDPKNGQVCQIIKGQIEKAAGGDRPALTIDVIPMTPERFREKVMLEHDYDLALTTFDYRDELYSLSGLLDPDAAGRNGRNYLGYLASGTYPTEADRRLKKCLDDIRSYRDFNNHVRELTWDAHTQVNQRVPFIPLWQLDRFVGVHRELELAFESPRETLTPDHLDPNVIFTGAEFWRLK